MTPKTSDEKIATSLKESPFHQLLGLQLESTDTGSESLTISMPFNAAVERAPGSGQYHGGIIASLIDIAGDYVLIWALGFGVPTINFRTDYLRPAFNKSLHATAKLRRVGRTVCVVDIDVSDDSGRLIAIGRGCYSSRAG